jgi:hypothetical protein
MNQVNIEEPGILKIDSKEIEMSMQLSLHGLSFCLFHKNENKLIALNNILNNDGKNLKDFFLEQWNSNRLINNDYASYKIIYPYRRLTIVPEALFSENDLDSIFRYNFSETENELIKYAKMPRSEAVAVFGIPEDVYNFVNSQVQCNWVPHVLPFVEANIKDYRLGDDLQTPKLFINCNYDFIDIIVIDESGIKLYNNFNVKSANDIVYYILNIYDKLKLNPEKVHSVFIGDINPESHGIITLQKFVRNVYFAARRQDLKYSYRMQEIAPHLFANLINLAVCEL